MNKFKIIWSSASKNDLNKIKNNISKDNLINISLAPKFITFVEQYQTDEFRPDCRRIIIGNYKILYQFNESFISIIRVVNCLHDPIKSIL